MGGRRHGLRGAAPQESPIASRGRRAAVARGRAQTVASRAANWLGWRRRPTRIGVGLSGFRTHRPRTGATARPRRGCAPPGRWMRRVSGRSPSSRSRRSRRRIGSRRRSPRHSWPKRGDCWTTATATARCTKVRTQAWQKGNVAFDGGNTLHRHISEGVAEADVIDLLKLNERVRKYGDDNTMSVTDGHGNIAVFGLPETLLKRGFTADQFMDYEKEDEVRIRANWPAYRPFKKVLVPRFSARFE